MIKILGAGLSGLSAAINLAKNEREATIFEKEEKVGVGKSNAQLLGNWETKNDILDFLSEINIDVRYESKLEKIVLVAPNLKNKAVIYSDDIPVGYVVLRKGDNSLENFLARKAKKLGVKILTGIKEKIQAEVIATGSKRMDGIGYGCVLKGNFDKEKALILFDDRIAPKGYVYLLPHSRDKATFAIAMRPKADPKRSLEKAMKHKIFRDTIESSTLLYNFSGYVNFSIPKTAKFGNSLLVGEAAGFQDAAFGFGMKYAFHSGYLAAKAIVENKDYDKLWKKAFLRDLKKSLSIRKIFDKLDYNSLLNKLIPKIGERSMTEFKKIYSSKFRMVSLFLKSLLEI